MPDFIYLSQNFPSTLPHPQLTRSKPDVVPIFTHQQTNIHLDTRPFATMPRRRRPSTTSTISSGDGDGLETRDYRDENEVLKAVAKDANEETFPVYLLEDVTVYSMDGKTLESLLEVTIKGKLLVRGRLVIPKDEPEIHHCKSTQHRVCQSCAHSIAVKKSEYNGKWITFITQSYSVGWGPSTIWAMGQRRWFEVRPSSQYEPTYAKMMEGLYVYYLVTEIHEQSGKKFQKGPVDEVFAKVGHSVEVRYLADVDALQYADLEGGHLLKENTPAKIKAHAGFLLPQMLKLDDNVNWIGTSFFKWLANECPVSFRRSRKARFVDPPQDIHRTTLQNSGIILPPSKPEIPNTSGTRTRNNSTPPVAGATDSGKIKDYERRQKITAGAPSTIETIHRLILDLKAKKAADKLSMASVWTALYHDLQLEQSEAKAIVRCYAKEIVDLLPIGEWKGIKLYKQLVKQAALSDLPDPSPEEPNDKDNSAKDHQSKEDPDVKKVPAEQCRLARQMVLKPRNKVIDRKRPVSKKRTNSGLDGPSNTSSSLTTPEPLKSQSLAAKTSVQRSGKNPGLRPTGVSSNTGNEMTDASSAPSGKLPNAVLGNGGRAKKRKLLEPEMGDVSDDEDEAMWGAMDSLFVSDHEEGTHAQSKLNLELTSVMLPSTEATGPNGSWVCPKEGCSTIIRDTEGEDAKEEIGEHQASHINMADLQYLVQSESRGSGLESNYLLAHLRKIGERARLEEAAMKDGALETVEPIKRANI